MADQPPEIATENAALWQLVQRIARSEIFARSEFLPRFLLYICDRQLRARTHEITEQQIGERVFGRPPGYSPGEDNIVRNYAGQLRKRLDMYYEREGKHDAVCISIPRGGYVPLFRPRNPIPESAPAEVAAVSEGVETKVPEPAPQLTMLAEVAASSRPQPGKWLIFAFGAGCSAAGFAIILFALHFYQNRPQQSASHTLWSSIFSNNQDTFIVPADSGLGILQNLTEQPAALADYANGKYMANVKIPAMDDANLDDLRTQRYTSIADLGITSRLARLPEVVPDRFVMRYARDLRMDDLRNGNAVLLGAIHTDPWVNLLQEGLNFQFVCENHVNECSIVNRHPSAGERSVYPGSTSVSSRETFAVIAFLPNLSRTGHVLVIGGLNMAGTQAAADMLLDAESIRPVIERAKLPNGTLQPFELLIETSSLGAEALPSRIIAARYGI